MRVYYVRNYFRYYSLEPVLFAGYAFVPLGFYVIGDYLEEFDKWCYKKKLNILPLVSKVFVGTFLVYSIAFLVSPKMPTRLEASVKEHRLGIQRKDTFRELYVQVLQGHYDKSLIIYRELKTKGYSDEFIDEYEAKHNNRWDLYDHPAVVEYFNERKLEDQELQAIFDEHPNLNPDKDENWFAKTKLNTNHHLKERIEIGLNYIRKKYAKS